MSKHNIIFSFLMMCIFPNPSVASSVDTLYLSLPQAIDIALQDHPTIKVADKEIHIKKVMNKENWQHLLPEASINARLDHTIKAAEMKLNGMKFKMGEDGTNSLNANLMISLPLYAPSVYKAMRISKTDIELATEKARATEQDLINQVQKAYFQLLLAQDSYQVILQSYHVAEVNYNVVKAKFDQGKVSEFDMISADVQLQSIKPNLVSANNAITLSALQLKVLLGITDCEIQLQDQLENYEKVVYHTELAASHDSLSENTTLKQLALNQNMLEQNLKMQRMNFVPTLGMSFSYQYQSIYNKNMNFFHYDWAGSSSLLFNLSIPIYRAQNFTKVRTTRLKMEQLEWQRQDVQRKLMMQVESYRSSMKASSEQVVSNRKNVAQAERAVGIANKRYEVGRGTVLELNSSQVSLTQAQLVYNQSIFDYLIAKSDLDKVLGRSN